MPSYNNLLKLVMIVKDSGEDIIQMLNNVQPYIDQWVILDTGSSDNTVKNIQNIMTKPGKLYREDFIDFSTSRNRVLDLAGDSCIFTIMLDDTYHISNGKELRKLLKKEIKKNIDAYSLMIKDENNIYPSIRILRSKSKLRYKHKIHENIFIPEGKILGQLHAEINDIVSIYMQKRTRSRQKNDIKLMEEELENYPDDRRMMLHLSRTYFSLNYKKLGIKWLNKICDYKITDDINFDAKLLLIQISANDIEEKLYIEKLEDLAKGYPSQAEAAYNLAAYYRTNNEKEKAFYWILKAASAEPDTSLMIKHNIYNFEIPYLAADISIINGNYNMAEKILKRYSNNGDSRLINMIYAISDISQPVGKSLNSPIIVLHTTNIVKGWNPKNMIKPQEGALNCSGSEIMAVEIAKSFKKLGFNVFVFGKFKGDVDGKNYDMQGIFDGVQYLDSSLYWGFIKQYIVDILIVSREVCNLVYLDNVKKVYLWLHDVKPWNSEIGSSSIQWHAKKFKKIICVSKWQAKSIAKDYKISNNTIYPSRNAILTHRFSRKPKKIPFRFIYTSSADRGLEYLLNMIPKIKNKFPKTTLHLFVNLSNNFKGNSDQLQKTINELDYVYLHSRVSQEELAHEYLISDIWLYPTDFTETYCIAALEAQAAGLLCACTDLAALKEIVGSRGITVSGDIGKEEIQDKLLGKLYKILENPEKKKEITENAKSWAMKQNFDTLASKWHTDIFKI